MVIVTWDIFDDVVAIINSAPDIAIDTEATGLRVYHGDKLFAIIVSIQKEDFYFNYNDNAAKLPRSNISKIISKDYKGRIFFHNAKYDMVLLRYEGLDLTEHNIYDTVGLARLEDNRRLNLKLDFLSKLVGDNKDDAVENYIKENKLFELVDIPSKKQPFKDKHFDKVPFDIISKYGCKDGNITLKLGKYFLERLAAIDSSSSQPDDKKIRNILITENKLTPILIKAQDKGMNIDIDYCNEALAHEKHTYQTLAKRYKELSGVNFIDSGKNHAIAFTNVGEKYPLTEKGNPSFTDEVLTSLDSPLSNTLKQYRYSYKKAHTYFANFLYLRDSMGIVHAQLNQYKPRTGRLSSNDPNLQNLNRAREGELYPVRRAFIPHEGESLFMLDFDQFEYRMMLNKAGEMGMIEQVLSGLDVHTATANLMGVPRQQAKTINFLLLYGGGIAVLARELFVTHLSEATLKLIQKFYFFKDYKWDFNRIANELKLEFWEVTGAVEILTKASDLKKLYFKSLPKVKVWVDMIIAQAERGFIYNEFGRAYKFNKNFAFKAPNYAIQGGTADWIKKAMVKTDKLLLPYKSSLQLQVHDELIFGVNPNERNLVYDIKEIMENVAPTEYLPYTVGIDYSDKSWGDKESYNG